MIALKDTTAGAPALNGVNGSLCSVLDWALPQAGWTIPFTATNRRAYRAGSGQQRYLSVRHDSAVSGSSSLASVRGAELMSDVNTMTDTFPTVAQLSDAAAIVATCDGTNLTTAREYLILLDPKWFLFFSNGSLPGTEGWDFWGFGEFPSTYTEDTWNTLAITRGVQSSAVSNALLRQSPAPPIPASYNGCYWCRDISGTVKSSRGSLASSSSGLGNISGMPGPRAGYGNKIVREKMGAHCFGSASSAAAGPMAIHRRVQLPNVYAPIHGSAGLAAIVGSTFTDTANAPGAIFRPITNSGTNWVIVEETDTWVPASG